MLDAIGVQTCLRAQNNSRELAPTHTYSRFCAQTDYRVLLLDSLAYSKRLPESLSMGSEDSLRPLVLVLMAALAFHGAASVLGSLLLRSREAHHIRQAAVFDSKVAFFSSPQATPKEVKISSCSRRRVFRGHYLVPTLLFLSFYYNYGCGPCPFLAQLAGHPYVPFVLAFSVHPF